LDGNPIQINLALVLRTRPYREHHNKEPVYFGSINSHVASNFAGRLSAKADVYSFGVVLLELLTGRRALEKSKPGIEQNLVDWAKPLLADKRRLYRIMDTKLGGQYPKKGAHAIANIALHCICSDAKSRPRMSQVLEELEQLQDSKHGPGSPQVKIRRASPSQTVQRSPLRIQPSPRRSVGAASPLSGYRTAQVH
jgi:serine/threonine protein kinase